MHVGKRWAAATIAICALSVTLSADAHRVPAELAALDARLEAVELDEDVVDALIERATLERLGGDFGAALADLNEAYTLDPEHPKIALQRGILLALLGYRHQAKQDLEAVKLSRAFAALASTDRNTSRARRLLAELVAQHDRETSADVWDDIEHPADAAAQLDDSREMLRAARR
jgi:tetratricopeptide (TPR) repeat protein